METLSPSKITTVLQCQRKAYWRYEIGLEATLAGSALRFGSAFHRALAARAIGKDYSSALMAAVEGYEECDAVDMAKLSGLLAGYYARYTDDEVLELHPEVEIRQPIARSRSFESLYIVDGLATMRDGRIMLVEHKTTSESIEEESKYWETIRYAVQTIAYVDGARHAGWDVNTVLWDAIKTPAISPRDAVPSLDEQGRKIVNDANGQRVFKKDGSPRESGDTEKGYAVLTLPETAEAFADRLLADCKTRPDFYFQRREISVLDDDIAEYHAMRDCVARNILHARKEQKRYVKPEMAWPRTVGKFTCNNCEYAGFCLQNVSASRTNIPSGMKLKGTLNDNATA